MLHFLDLPLRFFIALLHRGPKRLAKIQGVVVRLHPLPRRHRQAASQQRDVHVPVGFIAGYNMSGGGFPQLICAAVWLNGHNLDARLLPELRNQPEETPLACGKLVPDAFAVSPREFILLRLFHDLNLDLNELLQLLEVNVFAMQGL